MKKIELLAPAGNKESLIAAIEAGCDAIYLGCQAFGARSFAGNFSEEELLWAIPYAHLYNVKIYVTMNTLVMEEEVDTFLYYVDFLVQNHVDALIVQDLGMLDLIKKRYPHLELHASTQMHIHTKEGVQLLEKLGVKRVVLARELSMLEIAEMKKSTSIEIEVFGHGALCASYSGQCLMSSFIGGRSGNRGTCAQCCRQPYRLKDHNGKEIISQPEYLLSMKDLNTLENVEDFIKCGITSIKIEGRMKRPEYVYLVVSLYRKAIDSYYQTGKVEITKEDQKELQKMFYRGFTKGFLFSTDPYKIINSYRPNHLGIELGTVVAQTGNEITIQLKETLRKQDGIRFLCPVEDSGCTVTQMKVDHKVVEEAFPNQLVTIFSSAILPKGTEVIKTTDQKQMEEIHQALLKKTRRVLLSGHLTAIPTQPLKLRLCCGETAVEWVSDYIVERAISKEVSKEQMEKQLSRLQDTPYAFSNLTIDAPDPVFIPLQKLNELRRETLVKLDQKRLYREDMERQEYQREVPIFPIRQGYTVSIETYDQYQLVKDLPFHTIYVSDETLFQKVKGDPRLMIRLPRVMDTYPVLASPVLLGELGGLTVYPNSFTDFSFSVTNSYTLAFLYSLGVKRVMVSYELSLKQIETLIQAYQTRYHFDPCVEVLGYGVEEAMVLKPSLLPKQEASGYLVDRFHNEYPIKKRNAFTDIYHYENRKNWDPHLLFSYGVSFIRYQLVEEETLPFSLS